MVDDHDNRDKDDVAGLKVVQSANYIFWWMPRTNLHCTHLVKCDDDNDNHDDDDDDDHDYYYNPCVQSATFCCLVFFQDKFCALALDCLGHKYELDVIVTIAKCDVAGCHDPHCKNHQNCLCEIYGNR